MEEFLKNHIKLKHRIYLSYAISSLFLLAVIVISFFAFKSTSNDFVNFLKISTNSQINFEIIKNVERIQNQVLLYTSSDLSSSADKVDLLHEEVLNLIQNSTIVQEDRSGRLTPMLNNLKEYYKTFEELKKQKKLRDSLLRQIRESANIIEHSFHSFNRKKVVNKLIISKLLNDFLQIEKNAFRYFDTLDGNYVKNAKKSIKNINEQLALLQLKEKNPLFEEISSSILQYEKIFLEAVQRTRGYLYLVNVVMAAQAYEILYNADKLNDNLLNSSNQSKKNIMNVIKNTTEFLPLVGLTFLVLLAIFSYIILKSITSPITSLTETFNGLAQDENIKIKEYKLNDELGDLTKAATVFKNTNATTKELLKKSQTLTGELETKQMELERSNDELEQFVYTVSHDLKSPLVTSMGFIGIIKKLAGEGKLEEAISKLDKVVKSNDRMNQLIGDLLDLSRVGRIDFEKKSIDMSLLLENFKQTQKITLRENDITLKIEQNLPTIYANESRVLQIFENLISNAIKYAKNPNGTILEIGSKDEANNHLIFCKDNGPGISKEYHKKIFALFYRLDNSMEGTGIGLAIIQKVMKFHGGYVWVESQEGKGATFWLRFPKGKKDERK